MSDRDIPDPEVDRGMPNNEVGSWIGKTGGTPLDTLARQTALPVLAAGDLIAVLQSGAYGLTASPVNFLSHPAPKEVLVSRGEPLVI